MSGLLRRWGVLPGLILLLLAAKSPVHGRVTVADLMRQAQSFGVSRGQAGYYPPFDRDDDEDIDSGDLQGVAGRWRTACLE